jgi:uncharacterized protein
LESSAHVNVITGYGGGEVRLHDRSVRPGVIIAADRIVEHWDAATVDALDMQRLEPALALAPEIIVLGTGERLRFPPHGLRAQLQARGIGLEVMDTAAACRTYNVLVLENRRVVVALLPSHPLSARADT